MKNAKALLFPVRWLDPFGLAIIEILYLGAPVIGTRYGSLPEIITDEKVGFLSNNYNELIEAAHHVDQFDRRLCHQLAKEKFSSREMFLGYQTCYQRALDGEYLNSNTPYSAGGLTAPLPLH
ncbi:glycosyltransferase [Endozoicomonas sp. G2_1]|uniref:glycosyltransferase n=1 Tax=Endozoicomonas sp. G2_1 TaxID=2821091 RepID=UPI0032AFF881